MDECIGVNGSTQSALVVEGGAMRGIFAAGVLDAFLEENYQPFDFAIGVSAGSTNLISYLAGNHGRSRQILLDHARRADFIDWRRYLRGGHFCDISWLWHASYQDVPLNVDRYIERGVPLYAVTTSIDTGEARYLEVTPKNMHQVFPASCAIPVVYREFPLVDGERMTDGGLADSIPVIRAYQQGARDITVILSRPLGYRKLEGAAPKFIKPFFRDHAHLFEAVLERGKKYNRALEFIERPPQGCRVSVIAPPDNFPVRRFTQEIELLEEGYECGRACGRGFLKRLATPETPASTGK
ncbi:patatin family protein [Microbulbifer sp. SSSA002]|uniref:patatin-like phospholipase family protein n=1 Tax=unclassified Microbulbifer TaxID=2619833 RepID=UPI004039E387